MKPPDRDPVPDDDLDALLGSRLKETTREFEARWVDLKRGLRAAPTRRRRIPSWAAWLGWASTGIAIAAILLALHPWRPAPRPGPVLTPALDTLFTMDAVLAPAVPLLNAEDRDALLNLPAGETPHT